MPTLTIDGREIRVEPGTTVIQACEKLGIVVPRYCWHPGLSIAGNCRICQVEVVKPKLRWPTTISCNLMCADGMEIRTNSDAAKKARSAVMEFLLINHPLDCPICDQAGECILQEYSFAHGSDHTRFDEEKVHKSKRVPFSEKVMFDGERCILCTRCVRFCDEIAGEKELTVVERGDHNEIAVAPGRKLENPYSMNVIDLCPVGALTSTDFRFKTRVWFLTNVPSACNSCGRNCAVTVGTRWDKVMRLTPRENPDVNQWWMCDAGRLNYKYIHADDRLGQAYVRAGDKLAPVTVETALAKLHDSLTALIAKHGADSVFALVAARLTNEEIWIAKQYLDALGIGHVDLKPRTWEGDDLLRTTDRNPNTTGARILGVGPGPGGVGLDDFAAAVRSGRIRGAILIGDDLDDRFEEFGALGGLEFLASIDFRLSETAKRAHVVLPGATWVEKDGTVTNVDGFISRLNQAIRPPGGARTDLDLLLDLLDRAAPDPGRPRRAGKVFEAMGRAVPAFAGIRYTELYTRSRRAAGVATAAASGGAED